MCGSSLELADERCFAAKRVAGGGSITGAMVIQPVLSPWRIDLDRYHEMIAEGVFREGDRLELIEGVLTERSPKNAAHEDAIEYLQRILFRALDDSYQVRGQSALTFPSLTSEPEPDVAVVHAGSAKPFHPSEPTLVIEVAESSLRHDRLVKTRLYAMAGVPEYWIVNLVDRVVELHRQPVGEGYGSRTEAASGSLEPAGLPGVVVDLDGLLAVIAAAPIERPGA